MTHEQAIETLARLARESPPRIEDVTASVMSDVRRLATTPADDDRLVWRVAALLSATAAATVVVASIALVPADNPLAELAQQTTPALEVR